MLLTKRWKGTDPSTAAEGKGTDAATSHADASADATPAGVAGTEGGAGGGRGFAARGRGVPSRGGGRTGRGQPYKPVADWIREWEEQVDAGLVPTPATSSERPKKKESKKARRRRHKRLNQKDTEAAAGYLNSWLRKEEGASDHGWKFNKATQAWLLRHAYDPDLVEKDTFKLLLRYVIGLRGAARERLRTEAGAIILLKGAPLATPEEPDAGKKKKRRKEEPMGGPQEEDELKEEDTPAKPRKPDAEEVRRRKLRLKRAKQVSAAMEEDTANGGDE